MLKSLEKALRLSAIRESLNDLNAVTEPSAAQQTEERDLVGELKTCEVEYRDALQTEGLLTGTNLPAHAAAAVTTFATYLSAFGHSRVDGRYAAALSDVRAVVGSATYAHAGNQYRSNNADYSALDALDKKTGAIRVSAHVPAFASKKQNAVIRLGMHDRAILQVLWDGISLIPDEFTKAQSGEIAITAILLVATKILRSDSFHKQETQHVA